MRYSVYGSPGAVLEDSDPTLEKTEVPSPQRGRHEMEALPGSPQAVERTLGKLAAAWEAGLPLSPIELEALSALARRGRPVQREPRPSHLPALP